MTPGNLPGSRRFAEALLAVLVTLVVAGAVHAEEAAPATTTNADVAQPKAATTRTTTKTTTKKKVVLPAKPAADAKAATNADSATATNADAAKPAAAKSATKADAAKPAPAAADAKKSEPAKGATNADTTTPVAADAKKSEPAKGATNADTAKPAAPAVEKKSEPATTATNADAAKGPAATPAGAAAKPAAKPAAAATGAAAVAPAAPPASSPEAEAVWRAYEKRWSETEDYSAGFRQTIEVPDVGSRVESAGRFYFAKPGLVRWDYTEGPPQTVVGDGTWIWLYQPDLEQVYKIPYAKAFGRGGLVELLAGREGVSGRYATTLERPDPKTVRILLKSLTDGGNLEVTLEADSFDIREVTVHDAAGSTTHMIFAEPRRNHGADKTRFTFTPPAGVDIISDSEAGF